ncbi:MAG: hypothetical protein WAL27_10550, partial [Cellulosimicrobium cellulans]
MKTTYYESTPRAAGPDGATTGRIGLPAMLRPPALISACVAAAAMVAVSLQAGPGSIGAEAAVALCIFLAAVWFWIFSPVEDTYVALGAAVALVISGA